MICLLVRDGRINCTLLDMDLLPFYRFYHHEKWKLQILSSNRQSKGEDFTYRAMLFPESGPLEIAGVQRNTGHS